MEIIIRGDPKEIAALALELLKRQEEHYEVKISGYPKPRNMEMQQLEQRIVAIEEKIEARKEETELLFKSWESVLTDFAKTFGLSIPQLDVTKQKG